ncbi:TetR family transcriptional regulator [Streptomyces sp. KM273126]|uniref:TetR/AcrR family transcriptional regulator n=1 Tax=Streptomyces sp. KM273126 TaxID=2545247 RepID=UPI00103CB06C|nr:TetR/AcrR family transcriptional regulator [Streptomyces sp. KM273126]MBA2807752.1 TetR family transcriptional regulator [Streptomyces sp. KM273126]
MSEEPGLRERKKQRTRRTVIRTALRLFSEQGYEQTTVAGMAAAADIATRTFFSYFASKEDVVFFDFASREEQALAVIGDRRPGETVADLLQRTMDRMMSAPDSDLDLLLELAPARDALVAAVPALQARELHLMFELQRNLARALHESYPDELDLIDAMAAIGALAGAQHMAATAAVERRDSPEQVRHSIDRGTRMAIDGLRALDS